MTSPGAEPKHDKAHEHIDLGELMDASSRGVERPPEQPDTATEFVEEYGEGPVLSGEAVDGYISGQDEGSID